MTTPLRRLPVVVPPVHRETLASYLDRLATVNHLDPEGLADTAATQRWTSTAVAVKRRFAAATFACLTGYNTTALERALPELARPGHEFPAHRVLRACPRCTHRHRGGPVLIHPDPHQHVCLRHHLWLGTLGPEPTRWTTCPGPVDVSALPQIRAAQRRHHRLLHRHGHTATTYVVSVAVDAWDRAHRHEWLGRRQWDRLQILRPGATSVRLSDPAAHAVCYPEIITIASVLASPHWQTIAANPFTENAAYTEIIRRIREGEAPDPFDDTGALWPSSRHPLRYWAQRQQREERERDPDGRWDTLIAHLPTSPRLSELQR